MDCERIKVIILGSSGSGKSSLLYTYIAGEFRDHIDQTVGASFMSKQVKFKDKSVRLDLWDTAGETNSTFSRLYWRGARAILLVYDASNTSTISKVKYWHNIAKEELNDQGLKIFIAACKIDLVDSSSYEIPYEVQEFAQSIHAEVFKVSSKTNQGIEDLFGRIALLSLPNPDNKKSIALNYDRHSSKLKASQAKKKGCCG